MYALSSGLKCHGHVLLEHWEAYLPRFHVPNQTGAEASTLADFEQSQDATTLPTDPQQQQQQQPQEHQNRAGQHRYS